MENDLTKYEYKIVELSHPSIDHPSIDVEDTLNNFGKLGFKLAMKYTKLENIYFIMERELI